MSYYSILVLMLLYFVCSFYDAWAGCVLAHALVLVCIILHVPASYHIRKPKSQAPCSSVGGIIQ